MKKELYFKVLFYCINAYLISLLVYVTCKYVFSLDVNHISALGSILSAGATFLATVVAVLLYNDWNNPYQREKLDNHILKILETTHDLSKFILKEYHSLRIECFNEIPKLIGKIKSGDIKDNFEIIDLINEKFDTITDVYQEISSILHTNYLLIRNNKYVNKEALTSLKVLYEELDKFIRDTTKVKVSVLNYSSGKLSKDEQLLILFSHPIWNIDKAAKDTNYILLQGEFLKNKLTE